MEIKGEKTFQNFEEKNLVVVLDSVAVGNLKFPINYGSSTYFEA